MGYKKTNLAVDCGNMVGFTSGLPVAVYDADRVVGAIRVTDNYEGEFEALDGSVYEIKKGDLVVLEGENVMSLAGIIGSKMHGVTEMTTNLLVEAAHFDNVAIRKTANRLQVFTDAATRFMKGVSKAQVKVAISNYLVHAKELGLNLQTIGPTKVQGQLDYECIKVKLDDKKINNLLGTKIGLEDMKAMLLKLNFVIDGNDVIVPQERMDVSI